MEWFLNNKRLINPKRSLFFISAFFVFRRQGNATVVPVNDAAIMADIVAMVKLAAFNNDATKHRRRASLSITRVVLSTMEAEI